MKKISTLVTSLITVAVLSTPVLAEQKSEISIDVQAELSQILKTHVSNIATPAVMFDLDASAQFYFINDEINKLMDQNKSELAHLVNEDEFTFIAE